MNYDIEDRVKIGVSGFTARKMNLENNRLLVSDIFDNQKGKSSWQAMKLMTILKM